MVRIPRGRGQSGQAVMFILLALVILIFFIFFIVDLHRIIQRKDQVQNAGDAAALAAARWEGATLNLVGELNLMHALALVSQDDAAVNAITNMQVRLCFTGPMTGLIAAQVAAKNNLMYVNDDMTDILEEHSATVRNEYTQRYEGGMAFQEPWPNAWAEYADMLTQVASDGIAAGPDNMRTYDLSEGHMLLTKAFYHAVDGYSWCWFYFNAYGLLQNYTSYQDWPPLPIPEGSDYANSEIFGLGLKSFVTPLRQILTPDQFSDRADRAGFSQLTHQVLVDSNVMHRVENWYFYKPGDWGAWDLIKPSGEDNFPITGPVREQYDVAGADAIVRVGASVTRMTPNTVGGSRTDGLSWSAAAKPFGYLEGGSGKERVTAASYLVLPAFRHVRLIPVDAASGADNSSSDPGWVRHIRHHLKGYLELGTLQDENCRYCRTLDFWERNPVQSVSQVEVGEGGEPERVSVQKPFRQIGIDWLQEFRDTCRRHTGGGSGGGGTRRGH